jgi:membrane fusion protein (multidrug efflux system)
MSSFLSVRPALGLSLVAATIVGATAACRRGPDATAEQRTGSLTTLSPGSIAVLDSAVLKSGPGISGTLTPQREARVRAEVGGTVLGTYAEQGQRVEKGTLLARIDDRAVQDAYLSAKSLVRSAELNAQVAKRNAERSQELAQAGAISDRDLETATWNATNAEAQLADAQARLASAQKTLDYTTVRAPIGGIVSERTVSPGDVVQTGGALYNIVDPASLRLEGTVPAEQIGQLTPGAPVDFSVGGYPGKTFTGRIDRINPAADPATRQVRVYVSIPNSERRLVAGLYAEGRVGTAVRRTIVAPASAVDQRGVTPTVLRIRGGKVEQVAVTLGVKDEAADAIELRSGVTAGDTLLRSNAAGVLPGTAVMVTGGQTSDEEVSQKNVKSEK